MIQPKDIIGKQGEEAAKDFYKKHHYQIRESNWRFGHLEVDIIAEKEDILIFCEVKTRTSVRLGMPEEFVTKQKQLNLIRAANAYVGRYSIDKEVRFDIISIINKDSQLTIHHIPNAFLPKW